MKLYTKEEDEFLKKNYLKLSRAECAEKLNRTTGSIKSVLKRLGLKNTKKQTINKQIHYNRKSTGEFTVDETLFIDKINENTSYLLGVLWGDGYLSKRNTKQGNHHYRIVLSLKEEDALYIKPILETTGKWSVNKRDLQYSFHSANTILCKFLDENDYTRKSGDSAEKILSKIPTNLHKFFFLGYLDGDGCVFIKGKNMCITFTSVYSQDWKFLEKLCNKLNCKYYIRRVIRKTRDSRYSDFKINGYKNSFLFGRYIYNKTHLGFPRKKEKFNQIKSYIGNVIKINSNKRKLLDEIFLECIN